jgi:hypothetical protein
MKLLWHAFLGFALAFSFGTQSAGQNAPKAPAARFHRESGV